MIENLQKEFNAFKLAVEPPEKEDKQCMTDVGADFFVMRPKQSQ